ncbi:MAG: mannitol-1-phosphate 5-dehydrogenase [Firmicutes bacterium]|nr:mannitol-1-phosphate 5-dehydrogenase [Bacillota bacterium]
MQIAVVFGAGNIGRGFIGQLLSESGFETIFVDVVQDLVSELNRRGSYPIRIVTNEQETEIVVNSVRAISAEDTKAVAAAVSESSIVFTAVGGSSLRHIARPLAHAFELRRRTGGGPLNVIICENMVGADDHLRSLVLAESPTDETRSFVTKHVGFVMASVGRMVPVAGEQERQGDRLRLLVEPYCVLPVDADAVVGSIPAIRGVEPVRPFACQTHLKLYCHNCGHAIAAYLGYLRGYRFIYECMSDQELKSAVSAALEESAKALSSHHGVSIEKIRAHIDDLMVRFANRRLSDTVERVGKDPIRKLGPNDRLVGAARLAEAHGIEPQGLALGIAAALSFDPESDPRAVELRDMIRTKGLEGTLEAVAGIRPGERLYDLVVQQYSRLPVWHTTAASQ